MKKDVGSMEKYRIAPRSPHYIADGTYKKLLAFLHMSALGFRKIPSSLIYVCDVEYKKGPNK